MSFPVDHEMQLDNARNSKRLDVRMKASLRESGFKKFDIDVLDMSVDGFRFTTATNLYIGTRVWLTLPGKQGLESVVKWRDGYRYGCAFENAIHPAVFDHLIRSFG